MKLEGDACSSRPNSQLSAIGVEITAWDPCPDVTSFAAIRQLKVNAQRIERHVGPSNRIPSSEEKLTSLRKKLHSYGLCPANDF
jgi:hypothetical protein